MCEPGLLHDPGHLQVHGPRGVRVARGLALRLGTAPAPLVGIRDLAVLLAQQDGAKQRAPALGDERPGGLRQVVTELHRGGQLAGVAREVGEPGLGHEARKGVEVPLPEGPQDELGRVL